MVMNANTLTVVVPIDYYSEDLINSYQATLIDDNLVEVKIKDVDDVFLNCMSMQDFVEFIGIDSEFVVTTNWEDLM